MEEFGPSSFSTKTPGLVKFMEKWGHKFFNKFREKIRKQKVILNTYEGCETEAVTKRYFEERNKLEDLLLHEEEYWKQRAKSFWLLEGDSNSRFFHAYATSRKKKNNLTYLKDDNDEMVTDHDNMCTVVKEYFVKLFGQAANVQESNYITAEAVISDVQNKRLEKEFTFEEFSTALKQMHPDKSAGPDGLNPAFYQHFWGLFGKEVYQCCVNWLNEKSFPTNLNVTTIVLIPKKEGADSMKNLRPIALCNVLYKIIAKVLSNRLKLLLPGIISKNQSAFVPGRNITDNVLVAFEMIHYMRQKKRGEEGEVALKLDISKAYDRVDWSFLKRQMKQMGFSDKWIKWIILCVSTI